MKPWGGRFHHETDRLAETFQASLAFDRLLYQQDIQGSLAHTHMLGASGLLSPTEVQAIEEGLGEIRQEIETGEFLWDPADEDIHMAIEKRLTEKIGEPGQKLHMARSRNDQVALDLRLYVKQALSEVAGMLCKLQETLLGLAADHAATIMPGYTHLQRAQPITLGHHLMAYVEMFQRDFERLADAYSRTDVLPLGAGALAGTTLPIDREMVARELGFSRVAANSLDAVSDRDFVLDFIAAAAIIMMHLSRLAEELVLWSSTEFGFIEIGDSFTTGSSMMPQKKNPDVAELIRGKAGRVYGHHLALLTTLKGLPLAYNKDLQEDKEALFDTVQTLKGCLEVLAAMLPTIDFHQEKMEAAAGGFTLATDLAEYLVAKGVAFRQAHRTVGELVAWCLANGRELAELTLEEYRQFSPAFGGDVTAVTDPRQAVERHRVIGGPAPHLVRQAVATAKERLAVNRRHPMFGPGKKNLPS